MKIAVGSDAKTHLTDFVVEELKKQGHEIKLFGALAGDAIQWAETGKIVAKKVASKEYEQGILFCYTGTGVLLQQIKSLKRGLPSALMQKQQKAQGNGMMRIFLL